MHFTPDAPLPKEFRTSTREGLGWHVTSFPLGKGEVLCMYVVYIIRISLIWNITKNIHDIIWLITVYVTNKADSDFILAEKFVVLMLWEGH